MMGDRENENDGMYYSDDEEYTYSDDEQMANLRMTHWSIADEHDQTDRDGPKTQKKGAGRVTMAGQVLVKKVYFINAERARSLRESSRFDDLQNFKMRRRGSKARMSRRIKFE